MDIKILRWMKKIGSVRSFLQKSAWPSFQVYFA
jgi:hypothetical protein